jgi:hypothetical protein
MRMCGYPFLVPKLTDKVLSFLKKHIGVLYQIKKDPSYSYFVVSLFKNQDDTLSFVEHLFCTYQDDFISI